MGTSTLLHHISRNPRRKSGAGQIPLHGILAPRVPALASAVNPGSAFSCEDEPRDAI
jgi:hypothetical protein